jgi:L-fucose isomerase-like protein
MIHQPPLEPSRLESLPTEILVQIAQIAQDTHVEKCSPFLEKGDACPCCTDAVISTSKHSPVAQEVLSMGGVSRRIRAILILAGFFNTISLTVDVNHLFTTSVVSTEGFLENAKWVLLLSLHLAVRYLNLIPQIR